MATFLKKSIKGPDRKKIKKEKKLTQAKYIARLAS